MVRLLIVRGEIATQVDFCGGNDTTVVQMGFLFQDSHEALLSICDTATAYSINLIHDYDYDLG